MASLGKFCSDILITQGFDKWVATKTDVAIDELFSRTTIVYLSPDAPEVLSDISSSKVRTLSAGCALLNRITPRFMSSAELLIVQLENPGVLIEL